MGQTVNERKGLREKLTQAEANLHDLRSKAALAMEAVARQRIEIEKIKAELELVHPPNCDYRPVD